MVKLPVEIWGVLIKNGGTMGTLSSEIFDLFLTSIDDYRLTSIYDSSGSLVLDTYLEPWLLNSINEFDICNQPLVYTTSGSSTEGYFTETLTIKNKLILSQIMVKYWLQKTISDILQMTNFVQDHDFKTFSAAQNLKAKQDYYVLKKEEISQMLVDYSYKGNDWSKWKLQNFDGS
jgi:hypothetical protein